jgi:hypothetical protein
MAPVADLGYNAAKQARYRERLRTREAGGGVASLVRACIALGLNKIDSSLHPAEFARRTWDDHRVDLVFRAAVSPASLSNTPALTQISVSFLEALVPASAGADLLARGVGLNFAGAASITVPGIASSDCELRGWSRSEKTA